MLSKPLQISVHHPPIEPKNPLRDLSFVEKLEIENTERMEQAVGETEEWCARAKRALGRKLGVVKTDSDRDTTFLDIVEVPSTI